MIKILYFASVILSEVKNLRNVPAARNAEVPSASSGQAFASLRMAKLTGIKTIREAVSFCRLPLKLGALSG
ncbi:MAG: hypothetical protein ABR880_09130 [Candidatus Sulfotelmatobacter sp.]|jgi:hypothetical protein